MREALKTLRQEAHYDYMLGSERVSERAFEREQFCLRFAGLLGLDLGPVKR
jgi:hypothetical protein